MRADQKSLHDQIALVAGACSPLGSALARGLADLGARVYAAGPAGPALDALAGPALIPLALDVSSRPDFVRVVNHINAFEGRIDLLVNATSLTVPGLARDLSPEDWELVLDHNVMGTFNGIELVYPAMVERGEGHIVNLGSIAADLPESGAAPFAASKAFVLGLDRSMAPEAAHFGITLTLVLSGFLPPDLFEMKHVTGADPQEVIRSHTLSPTSAEEVAAVITAGILRKKRWIFVPPIQTRILWCLSHWFPFLLAPLQRRFLRPFRESTRHCDVP